MNKNVKQAVDEAYSSACIDDRFNFDKFSEALSLNLIKQCALIALIEQHEPYEQILKHFDVEITYL